MSTELALRPQASLFPSEGEWKMLKEQAAMAVKTGLLPRAIDTPEKAIAIALKGRELGVPPMQAYSHIHIIDGKPTMSAELMLSQIYRNCPGAVIDYLENTDKKCVIEAKRPGHKLTNFSYSIDEARLAGLLNKVNWQKYPAAMLRARTVAIVARAVFADAIGGCSYIPEELGADVDAEGDVITIPAPEPRPGPTPDPKPAESKPAAVVVEKPKERTRKDVGIEIMTAARDLSLTKEEVEQWAFNEFKKPSKDMSLGEMEQFRTTLLAELVSRGEST